uniref:Uncharacterized protein n=1 Tax=Moniliophthora roreri TaxID=221103 RepID=A0A0W0G6X1_MONRR
MRFSTLIVLVATFFATQVVAYNPIGQPYDTPGGFGCEQYPADPTADVLPVAPPKQAGPHSALEMEYVSDGRLSRVDR